MYQEELESKFGARQGGQSEKPEYLVTLGPQLTSPIFTLTPKLSSVSCNFAAVCNRSVSLVPNAKRNMVTLRELLESKEFQEAKSNVSFAVGKCASRHTASSTSPGATIIRSANSSTIMTI